MVESLAGAGETLASYINQRVEELDEACQEKMKAIVVEAGNTATPEQMEKVVANIGNWEKIDFDEKRFTVEKMITQIRILPGEIKIEWKF